MTDIYYIDDYCRSTHDWTISLLVNRLLQTGYYDELRVKEPYRRKDEYGRTRCGEWDLHAIKYDKNGLPAINRYYEVKPTVDNIKHFRRAEKQFKRTERTKKLGEDWKYVMVAYNLEGARRVRL